MIPSGIEAVIPSGGRASLSDSDLNKKLSMREMN